jgi:hypothetical protein
LEEKTSILCQCHLSTPVYILREIQHTLRDVVVGLSETRAIFFSGLERVRTDCIKSNSLLC